jgi:serine/threonine-protein kinase
VIPGYRIVRRVGRGGMGVVYEAVEEALGRTVALKIVAPERAGEPGFRERFISESKLAAAIDHPNVLPVFGAGECDGTLYLTMRFVDGADLRSLGPLSPMRAAAIVAQVGAALDAAHSRRLVHRDVKPGNVLVGEGDHAYLTDFGLVKALDASAGVTRTGELVGTLDYIAPERIRGESTGPASDLYSLGCVLYFALTGQVVFGGDSAEQKLWAHLSSPPPTVPGFEAVLARALAKEPSARFESGAALGAAAVAAAGDAVDPLDAARRSERGIRAAAPGSPVAASAAGALAALEHAASRAQLLREALADAAPERVERRLAEVRAGNDPGKARLVAALARQLAVARRMRAALAAYDADVERIVVELETARGRVLADSDPGSGLAALQDELETLAELLGRAGGESDTLGA